jgi:hypothetical protein
MYHYKEIECEKELNIYVENFYRSLNEGISGNTKKIPMEYLKRSKVVGLYNEENIMVAGYIIGHREPLRLLDFVPEDKKAEMDLPEDFQWEDCCEVVCVWKKKTVTKLYMGSEFWPIVLNEVLSTGKKYLLGHNQCQKLNKHYSLLGPKSLYFGLSTYGLPSNLFIYNRIKLRVIKLFAKTIFPLTMYFKKKKQHRERQYHG